MVVREDLRVYRHVGIGETVVSYKPTYTSGEWKCLCDICGREFLASELQKRWDGFMVCDSDYEPRHPQDFVRGVADYQAPPYTRPEPADQFVSTGSNDCTALFYYVDTTVSSNLTACTNLYVDADLTLTGSITVNH